MSLALLGEQVAAITFKASGYSGVVRSATLYAVAQEVDFDQQLLDARKVVLQDTTGADRTKFFVCVDGKAQFLMANCKNSNADPPPASVCWFVGAIGLVGCQLWLEHTIDG